MTSVVDIVNRALQAIGTRTTVTADELANQTSNEAIQASLILTESRDGLLRMAPWDCSSTAINLGLITSLPGTPENQTPGTASWTPGLPLPPWAYEYQYPVDCLRALYVVPAFQPVVGNVPIYPIATGYSNGPSGPPVRFKVGVDQFYSALTATPTTPGTGNQVGDIITLAKGPATASPIGAPAQLLVTAVDGTGGVTATSVVNSINGASPATSGAYFSQLPAPQAIGSSTGMGIGSTFTLTYSPLSQQRVILTNQELATLMYCRQVTDPNMMDPLFRDAWVNILAAGLAIALTGDKSLANMRIQLANQAITLARATDANEGLTINDVTPDFLRVRGVVYSDYFGGGCGTDWGPSWSTY